MFKINLKKKLDIKLTEGTRIRIITSAQTTHSNHNCKIGDTGVIISNDTYSSTYNSYKIRLDRPIFLYETTFNTQYLELEDMELCLE